MNDKAALLEQLRIERPSERTRRLASGVWLAALVIVIGGAAGATWAFVDNAPRVRVAAAEPVTVSAVPTVGTVLDASGYVVARRQATVSAKITGKVVAVMIEEGQFVERDDVIARLDDANARAAYDQARAQREQARANLEAARVAFENARPTFARSEQQFVRAVISAQAFDTARAGFDGARTSLEVAARAVDVAEASVAIAERALDDTVVRAPFAGVVTVKAAQEGEMVSPISAGGGFTRTGLGTIVDMRSLEIEVDVSENFINRVMAGQRVTARPNAYPDWEIPAHVIAVIPTADRAKATVKVRVGFDAVDARVLPQMGVRVAFLENAGAEEMPVPLKVVSVPAAAVQRDGDVGIVFVVASGRVERRSVRLGARDGATQIVSSGLTAGTEVVVGELESLADGMKVRAQREGSFTSSSNEEQ